MIKLDLIPAYVSVRLHPDSLRTLIPLYTQPLDLPVKPLSPHDLHVTIMTSLVHLEDRSIYNYVVQPNLVIEATITGPKQLGPFSVLGLESEALIEREKAWADIGLISKWPTYVPHLSFAKTKLNHKLLTVLAEFEGMKIKLHGESIVQGRL